MAGTIEINGTGGIIEGDLGSANVNVNLDPALNLDGTDNTLVASSANFRSSDTQGSITAWIKTTSTADMTILSAGDTGSTSYRMKFYLNDGKPHLEHRDSSLIYQLYVNTAINDGGWHHVAAVSTGSAIQIYIDGVSQTVAVGSGSNNGDWFGDMTGSKLDNVVIGALTQSSTSTFFNGYIADVRYYNDNLPASEMLQLASKINTEVVIDHHANMQHRWKLNSATLSSSGLGKDYGVATDIDLTPNHIVAGEIEYDAFSVDVYDNSTTTDGTFTVTQGKVEGLALSSVDLNGTDDSININNALKTWTERAQKTFSAWVYNDGNASEARVFNTGYSDTGNATGFALGFSSGTANRPFYFLRDTSASGLKTQFGDVHTVDTWMHYAIVQDGANNQAFIYQNGVLQATVSSVGEITQSTTVSAKIGVHWQPSQDNYFNGQVRDLKLYNDNLSTDQVASLYSGDYNVTPAHWWKLDEGYTSGTTANTLGAFEDSGTGTDYDAQGTSLVNASCVNGTLDLDGTLTIAANGTLSAPRGNLDIEATDFDTTGTFTHNNGKVRFVGSGNHITILPNGRSFYNVDVDKDSGHDVKLREDMIVENVLDLTGDNDYFIIDANGAGGDVTLTMGTSSASGTIESNSADRFRLNPHSSGNCIIQGASTLYPCNVTGQDWKWDYGSGAAPTQLANMNFQVAVITDTGEGNAAKLTLTGDCEFDAVTVSSGDTFDLNNNRAVFSGMFNTGLLRDTGSGNGQIWTSGGINFGGFTSDGSLTTTDYISTAVNTHYLKPFPFRTVFMNGGSGSAPSFGNYAPSIATTNFIMGSGTLNNIGQDGSATGTMTVNNATIATGGILTAGSATLSCAGDFTTSGGLIGKSALDFDGVDDLVNCGHNSSLANLFDSGGTVEAWIKPDSDGEGNDGRIADKGKWIFNVEAESGSTMKLRLYQYFDGMDASFSTTDRVITKDKWNHVALTYDNSSPSNLPKIYVDGKQVALTNALSTTGTRDTDADDDFIIGNSAAASKTFDGHIAMVRAFSDIRTEAEIRTDMFNAFANMSSTHLLEGMWQFDEGSGASVDNVETEEANDGTITGATWAGAGTFNTSNGQTLVMAKSGSQKIYTAATEIVRNFTVNAGSTTDIECVGSDSGSPFIPQGNVTINGTLSSTSVPLYMTNDFVSNSGTFTFGGSANLTGLNSIRCVHTSGTINLPACTTPRVLVQGSGGTVQATGDITATTELEVNSGATFNANGNTITAHEVDCNSTATLNLANSTLSLSRSSGYTWNCDSAVTLLTGNTTVIGRSAAEHANCYLPSAGGFEIVGDVKWLKMRADADLTVIGSVTECSFSDTTGNIRQWHHTLDTQQLLDADSDGDDDLRLTKPSLDNSHELMTG